MKNSRNFLVMLSLLFLSALACARTGASLPAIPPPSTGLPAGRITRVLNYDGRERSYILYVPASVNWDQPVPLVLVFHGGTGNAESAIYMSEFNTVADQKGFITAYPNGTSRLSDDILLTWNAGDCCGYAQQKDVDDVGFARAVVADIQSLTSVDAKRIYATGMSNGGMLSHRLACEASEIFAAIAPVAGTLNFPQCSPSQPISIIEFHGTGDQHLPYEGGYGSESLVNVDFVSVRDSIEFWASFNECTSPPQINSFDDIQHEAWAGCTASTSVELYSIIEGGHTWPGGTAGRPEADQPTQTISASELIWEFFAAHPKP